MIPNHQDAFGHAILDYHEGRNRETAGNFGCNTWFGDYANWFERERLGIGHAQGHVLDIGCAAGRHTLYLQDKGHDVVAIDYSPLAIEVCRRRGVKDARVLPVTQVSRRVGTFDTILMLGNNFGLVGNLKRGCWLFRRLKNMTPPDGVVIAGDGFPDMEKASDAMRATIEENMQNGRLPGEFVLRPTYRTFTSPPIHWLYASPEHVATVLEGTGWLVSEIIEDGTGAFVAIIRKC